MVHRVPALLVRVPLEQRKLGDPDESEVVGAEADPRVLATCSRSRPSTSATGLVGAAHEQQQVARACRRRARTPGRSRSAPSSFQRRALHARRRRCRAQATRPPSAVPRRRRDRRAACATYSPAPGDDESAQRAIRLRQLVDEVRQTRPRTTGSRSAITMPGRRSGLSDPYFSIASSYDDARKRRLDREPGGAEHRLDGAFDDAVDELFGRERHLDVDLRELGLAIGAQIFVAEAPRRSGSSDPCPRSSGSA